MTRTMTIMLILLLTFNSYAEEIILRPSANGDVQEWVGSTDYKYIDDPVLHTDYPDSYSCDDPATGKPLVCEWKLGGVPKTNSVATKARLWVYTHDAEIETCNIMINGEWLKESKTWVPAKDISSWKYFEFELNTDLKDGLVNNGFRCIADAFHNDTTLEAAYLEIFHGQKCDCGCEMVNCKCKE